MLSIYFSQHPGETKIKTRFTPGGPGERSRAELCFGDVKFTGGTDLSISSSGPEAAEFFEEIASKASHLADLVRVNEATKLVTP